MILPLITILNLQFQIYFRVHKTSMRKLKKLLSDQAKDIRHRRHQINIHITLLGWVVEFFSFLLIMLGSFILGHGNATVTLLLQTLSLFMMFNVLPCVYLVNEGELKNRILESDYYFNFLRILKVEKNNVTDEENEGCNEDNHGENKDENLVNDGEIGNQEYEVRSKEYFGIAKREIMKFNYK